MARHSDLLVAAEVFVNIFVGGFLLLLGDSRPSDATSVLGNVYEAAILIVAAEFALLCCAIVKQSSCCHRPGDETRSYARSVLLLGAAMLPTSTPGVRGALLVVDAALLCEPRVVEKPRQVLPT